MKILTNNKIKSLFCKVLICISVFVIFSVSLLYLEIENAALYIFIFSVCMFLIILITLYKYFNEQNKIIENAQAQITE